MKNFILIFLVALPIWGFCQSDSIEVKEKVENLTFKRWYNTFAIRGYAQVRYNRLLESNENLRCDQCDRSWGKGGGFFIRRMRIIFFGQLSERVYFYIQPDFASSAGAGMHFAQLRDAYFDIGIDKDNEFRFRIGQSKVPFGFENLQSSQNRLPLDRNDGLNSAIANERDLGVFFYWAPKAKRQLFSRLVREGLKGSGDYGIVGFGVYNGQTANQPELNEHPHIVGRVSYPFELERQILEVGVQGYSGKYVMSTANISNGVAVNPDLNYTDQRVGASFVLYPQPFGIQAEYNIGRGPEFNKVTNSIEVQDLQGGYITCSYLTRWGDQFFIPFMRYTYYDGGKKFERDARSYNVNDFEIGFEWQMNQNFELVMNYTISKRRFEDFQLSENYQEGNLLRIQAQVNF